MRYFIAAAIFAVMLAVSGSSAEAQASKSKQAKQSGYSAAVCACRATSRGGEAWAACMKRKGHNAAPGSGWGVAC